MSNCDCQLEAGSSAERQTLYAVLGINAGMFGVELISGFLFVSAGLIADSLDMLADAGVYALSLYAVGRASRHKVRAAYLSGMLQIALGLAVLAECLRRLYFGSEPESLGIMLIGAVALIANVACLFLIAKHRRGEIHMQAAWIFSVNDVLANIGVIAAGALVAVTGSNLPDLIAGLLISSLVISGGRKILRESAAAESDNGRRDQI